MADTDPPLFQQFIDRFDILERIIHIKSHSGHDATDCAPEFRAPFARAVVLPQSLHHRLMFIERKILR